MENSIILSIKEFYAAMSILSNHVLYQQAKSIKMQFFSVSIQIKLNIYKSAFYILSLVILKKTRGYVSILYFKNITILIIFWRIFVCHCKLIMYKSDNYLVPVMGTSLVCLLIFPMLLADNQRPNQKSPQGPHLANILLFPLFLYFD